jgi:putative ABC transport system substrate-binding protein
VSLGPDMQVMAGQGADVVSKIIKGAKPSELPVEQPTRYEMFINLRADDPHGADRVSASGRSGRRRSG